LPVGDRWFRRYLGFAMATTFLFTVDVESKSRGNPGQDIFGELPGHAGKHGIGRMMDLLERHQVRGTFFLNVYEAAKHGEEALARTARAIHSRGHDLELHTHPRPMYRPYGMSQASFEEQLEILEKGIGLIGGWTGKRVVAHRAGAFLANGDTLRALTAAGLAADCSLAPGNHDAVPLMNELGASNSAQRVGGVWEIPVTYYDQLRIGPWRSRRILDIEASSLAEIKRVTRAAVRQGLPTVCILMHSFSFTRAGQPDERVIRRFSALLEWLRQQADIQIGTVEETCRRLDSDGVPESPSAVVPYTGFWLTWTRALQSWNNGWKNFAVSVTGIVCFAILILAGAYLGYALIQR
jgi:peptidoglycan/xylan/chitin deacetylase (PgdA/CDA1 family)